jgi:uncharacterized 2Fe-2S/4Fe-4S cluster protein (DUF4445 family)
MSSLFHDGHQIELVAGRSIFEYADELKLRVPTSCGRSGECHECIVEVKRGLEVLNPITKAETFLRDNYRLACQATIANPVEDLEFALLRRQPQILTDSIKRKVKIDPLVKQYGNGVYLGDKLIDDYRGKIYGLAIDLGTTSIAMNLVDLETASTLATTSYENPQRFGGSERRSCLQVDQIHGDTCRPKIYGKPINLSSVVVNKLVAQIHSIPVLFHQWIYFHFSFDRISKNLGLAAKQGKL